MGLALTHCFGLDGRREGLGVFPQQAPGGPSIPALQRGQDGLIRCFGVSEVDCTPTKTDPSPCLKCQRLP
jgi:hypothetical protein